MSSSKLIKFAWLNHCDSNLMRFNQFRSPNRKHFVVDQNVLVNEMLAQKIKHDRGTLKTNARQISDDIGLFTQCPPRMWINHAINEVIVAVSVKYRNSFLLCSIYKYNENAEASAAVQCSCRIIISRIFWAKNCLSIWNGVCGVFAFGAYDALKIVDNSFVFFVVSI